jgi:hypothetical protein
MGMTLSTGTTVSIASTYGAAKTFASISNATQAVASYVADPGHIVGDIIEVTSGWGRLNGRVVRVSAISGAGPYLVTFDDVDTSDTAKYPAAGGAGTTREITAWTEITQIKSLSASGGDPNYADITTMSDVTERQMPTTRGAVKIDLEVFDDPTLSFVAIVTTASDSNTVTGMKLYFANGSTLYANAYWSIQKVPGIAKNEALTSKINASYTAEPIRYAD